MSNEPTVTNTVNPLLDGLRKRIVAARVSSDHQNNAHPTSRSAGYEEGYVHALEDVWQHITGEEFK